MNRNLTIYGKHAVISMLEHNSENLIDLYITEENLYLIEKFNIKKKINLVSAQKFNNLLPSIKAHQNIMAICLPPKDYTLNDLNLDKNYSILICLDQVTDISNIGAILRSGAAFQADALLLSKNNSPNDLSHIYKTASGAAEIIPIIKIVNFSNLFEKLRKQGYWIIGLDGNTQISLPEFTLPPKIAIILGSENKGMRNLTRTNCDVLCKIPISSQMESLNVAHCASIILYEYHKLYKNITI